MPTARDGEAADSQEDKFPYSKKQKTDLTGDGGVVIRITGRLKKGHYVKMEILWSCSTLQRKVQMVPYSTQVESTWIRALNSN